MRWRSSWRCCAAWSCSTAMSVPEAGTGKPRASCAASGVRGWVSSASGRTGRALVERASALGFEVWGTDPALDDDQIAASGARPAALGDLLAACHAVSLHVALTSETDALLGADELALMPDGAVLVDTARPQLVDLDALRRELESGRLGGAALDVIPVEPPTARAPGSGLAAARRHAARRLVQRRGSRRPATRARCSPCAPCSKAARPTGR